MQDKLEIKKIFSISLVMVLYILIFSFSTKCQDLYSYKSNIGNFVRRMYNLKSFNGVKILKSQDDKNYLITVVTLDIDPKSSEQTESRIASVKAKAFLSQYLTGSSISYDVIVITSQQKLKDSTISKTEMKEILKETSRGYVEGIELLINFITNDSKHKVFVYYKELN